MSSNDTDPTALNELRTALVERLRARRREIEEAIYGHVRLAVPDPVGDEDAEYLVGLRAAVAAAVDYVLVGIELGEDRSGPVPLAAILQAGRAARGGLGLDTVLLRYVVGNTLLEDFVMEEAELAFVSDEPTRRYLRRTQGTLLGRLAVAIAEEHLRELRRTERSSGRLLYERVQRLLGGGPLASVELGYDIDAWHLGVIATGAEAEKTVRGVAAELGRGLLVVCRGEGTVWAWLGDTQRFVMADVGRVLSAKARPDVSLAVGEPAQGITGFRLTHRQAQAALLVALRKPQPFT